MNLTSDKKGTSLKKVYIFYSVIITICILALFVFNLNIYAKAVLCALILLCVLVMRSLKHAVPMPPDIDTETKIETEETPSEKTASTARHGGAIDTYLTLLIETDEELKNDPSVDTSSPSYTNLLNERIGMKLNAMSKRNNHSDND
jgi:Ca2+/Na+ antiporter